MKKLLLLFTALLTVGVLAACGNDDTEENTQENTEENTGEQGEEQPQQQAEQEELEIKEEELLAEDEQVAVVNGEDVTGKDYNPIYTQVKTTMHQMGQDTSNQEQVKSQAVAVLVEQELVKQDAMDKNIEVTDEEVQTELDAIQSETSEEEFATLLEQYNMTEKQFKDQLKVDLLTVQYMDETFDVEVTDKEVQDYYDQLKAQSEEQSQELPALEELESRIHDTLLQEKQSQKLRERVETLRANAEVEEKI